MAFLSQAYVACEIGGRRLTRKLNDETLLMDR